MTKSRGINRPHRRWTELEVALLTKNYADSRTEDLATVLERPLHQVYGKARKLGLAKSQEYLDSPAACRLRRGDEVGKAYRFEKGIVPANKGLRRPGYSLGRGRMRETQFKAGQKCKNWLPIGSHRINGDGYLDRKITDTGYPPRDWKGVHRLVWEAANGPIPAGHIVRFKDGRRTTDVALITLDALELLTLAENLARNRLPPELQALAQLRGVLTRTINRRAREAETT
jgi:HNH endonuclease